MINIKTSATLAINELSYKLEKRGKKIYKFGLGQSPFPVPKIVEQELIKNAHQKNYINVSGLEELRVVIAKYHTVKNRNEYLPENIIIGPGSKELIFQTQLVMDCDLLLPNPSWVSYEPQAHILNKKVHWIKTNSESNWHLLPDSLDKLCLQLSSVNKLLILNSPNNPSGTTHGKLKELAKVAKHHNLIILSDEIYAELDFSGEYKSISHYYPEGTIISSGLSKWCGAGGWRIGNLAFPKELTFIKDSIRAIASETFTSVSAPIQYAAIKAYSVDHSRYLQSSRIILKAIAEYIYKELSSVGVKCQKPQGGFYIICDFTNIIKKSNEITDSKSLCNKILKDIGFAMLPGSDFGINKELLISRIAYVDFDGTNALKEIEDSKTLNDSFLELICPNILKGIRKLKEWIIKRN
ncbi:aminotransferase class I/II-fold pyridoxal phosphate-dependent enzyme [Alphaproteobacteria bacterium]|nr:aminotransferase class I/II-fold pyridoxal phosphate-dependent enzyme [Alphaproteobacteria bacterium]